VSAPVIAENTEILQANREAHRARWGLDPCASVTAARSAAVGEPTVRGGGESGVPLQMKVAASAAWFPVHAADRPLDEARAWLATALKNPALKNPALKNPALENAPEAVAICAIGAGAGWVIDAVEEVSGEMRVLVLEPEPAFCAEMLARRDFRRVIETGRLMILPGPAFEGAQNAWRLFARLASEPPMLVHPVIAVARREATLAAARVAKKAIADALANERARRRFAAPYLLNTLRNVPALASESDAGALFNLCPGAPIVIAGAGPSLNRNLEELRPYRDRAVLIVADTALRPTLAAGLTPDFVVAVDPGAANARHLTQLPPCTGAALVAESSVQSASLDAFVGRTFLFRVASHQPWPWLAASGVDVAMLRAWGSVMITAFDLGVKLGGSPLILIGSDLAYTGGQPYCRNTVYENDWTERVAAGESLQDIWRHAIGMRPTVIEHHGGEDVVTAAHLVQFRDGLLHAAQSAPSRVVNATGAGILRGGRIEQGSLTSLLESAPSLPSRTLPRRVPAAAVVSNLREAVRAFVDAQSIPEAWGTIFEEHHPPDASLPAQLDSIRASVAGWADAAG
jgi:hypothetical protein